MNDDELQEMLTILEGEGITEIGGIVVRDLALVARGTNGGASIPTAQLASELLRQRAVAEITSMALETVRTILMAAVERGDLRLDAVEVEQLRPIWGIKR